MSALNENTWLASYQAQRPHPSLSWYKNRSAFSQGADPHTPRCMDNNNNRMADGEQAHVKSQKTQNTSLQIQVKDRVCEDSSSDIQNVIHTTSIKDPSQVYSTNS